jgi:hypothetical protein
MQKNSLSLNHGYHKIILICTMKLLELNTVSYEDFSSNQWWTMTFILYIVFLQIAKKWRRNAFSERKFSNKIKIENIKTSCFIENCLEGWVRAWVVWSGFSVQSLKIWILNLSLVF